MRWIEYRKYFIFILPEFLIMVKNLKKWRTT